MDHSKHVIIIDDDELSVYLYAILLRERFGEMDLEVFGSAEEALDHILGEGFRCPDLILLDINLPSLDAWDLLRELEDQHVNLADLPLVLLSSHIRPEDWEHIHRYMLCEAVLIKPLKMDRLLELGIID